MGTKKIILVESQAEARNALKELLSKNSFEVIDFNNSMSAIQWIKQNGNPKLLILEEKCTPLNSLQTLDYLDLEIGRQYPCLIIGEPNTDTLKRKLISVLNRPFTDATILKINEFLDSCKKEMESEKKYSLSYLEKIGGGNYEFIEESIKIFKDSVASRLIEIQEQLDQKNVDEIRKIAHNIKPSFEMISNDKGTELCHLLANAEKYEALPQLVEELKKEFEDVNAQITADLIKK
ncbi:Hpt domain-containing protein [Maribacter sp. X9]|uniref:Hpt domain-containing protein n=1 Tax=Maribacter sp. X9 TaxID=3402159 RepID=UPI003AF3B241